MNLAELKSCVVKKQVPSFMIFTGEEIAIMDIYIKQISETSGLPILRANSVESIYSKLQNATLVSKANCYIIRDDKTYTTQEKVWSSVSSGAALGDNIMILVYTSLDKRGKFFKQHSEKIVEFEKLSPMVLTKYIRKEIPLDEHNAAELAQICDYNYSRILLECDKLKHLCRGSNITADQAYMEAMRHKVIHVEPQGIIFEFIDAVCKRQVRKSYEVLTSLIELDESPLAMLSLLYTNFKAMLMVRGAGNSGNLTEKTGLPSYQVKLAIDKGTGYTIPELVSAVRTIRETERGIKTGRIDTNIAIDYVLVNIL